MEELDTSGVDKALADLLEDVLSEMSGAGRQHATR